ncbi:MAG TPA: DHHA1 domain-containing protein, partial [Chlamydiales bacterium]|nr:DHHA1 domain-containing protein [Chlamydiales bacterium]
GAKVRVVDADFSKELCGGTHVDRTGKIGYFRIMKESSIAAGVRRIEAVSGKYAEEFVYEEEDLLQELGAALKVPVGSLSEKLTLLLDENKKFQLEFKQHRKGRLKQLADEMALLKEQIGHIPLIAQQVSLESEELALFAEELLQQIKSGVVALGATIGERCQLLIAVSPDLVQKQINAVFLIKEAAPLIKGGGGGKPHLAQAGGKDPQGLSKALDTIRHSLKTAK